MLFNKKKNPKSVIVDGKKIELQPKPGLDVGSFFKQKQKAKQQPSQAPKPTPTMQAQPAPEQKRTATPPPQRPSVAPQRTPTMPQRPIPPVHAQPRHQEGFMRNYIRRIAARNKGIEDSLKAHGMKESVYDFIQRMLIASIIVAAVIGAMVMLLMLRARLSFTAAAILGIAFGYLVQQFSFNSFLRYPLRKEELASRNIERDILFAARDMIISLRSGMPLYNAIVLISTGYGDASKEFARIAERAQLGMSLEDAIDQTVTETKSQSFRRIMLQASTSIKAGADIVAALQTITDQLSQERLISLRRYGQRLNAIAMFYMLFGVIMPSMGIAVATILTTFISVFTVNASVLEAAIIGIIFLQIVFLQMIRTSRPIFAL